MKKLVVCMLLSAASLLGQGKDIWSNGLNGRIRVENGIITAAPSDTVGLGQALASASSGLPGYQGIKRTIDTTNSVATPIGVGDMAFAVTSGTYYAFKFIILYSTGATTTGIKLSLTFPTATVQSANVLIFGQTTDGATTEPWAGTINSSGDVVTSTGVAVINVPYVAIVEGTILPSSNGSLQLRFSPEVAAAATIKRGSLGYIWSF